MQKKNSLDFLSQTLMFEDLESPEEISKNMTWFEYGRTLNETLMLADKSNSSGDILEEIESIEAFTEITDFSNMDEETPSNSDRLKSFKFECERIKVQGTYYGTLDLSANYIMFTSDKKNKKKQNTKSFCSALMYTMIEKDSKKIWTTQEINEVYVRRFIHRHTAIEIFLNSGKSIFFNFFTEENKSKVLDFIINWKRAGISVHHDPREIVKYTKL